MLGRSRRHRELDEEIQAHLDMAVRERVERGEDPGEAAAAVRREFGSRALVAETTRAMWGWTWLESVGQDARYGLRAMRRSPGFTAVAVLSLALGIGANTAIFSLVDTLMLRLLPVPHPEQLVEFIIHYPLDPPGSWFSRRSYEYFRDHNHVFSAVSGCGPGTLHVSGAGLEPVSVAGEMVLGDFFSLLGLEPAIGRLIAPGDERAPVAVLSWPSWKNRFGMDPAVVGRHIVVEGRPATIIGVLPRAFTGLQVGAQPEIWIPAPAGGPLALMARLRPGVSLAKARAEMAVLFRFTYEERVRASQDALMRQLKFWVEPAGAGLLSEFKLRFAKPLLALMGVVAALLLIACASLAGLLLARGAARQREMALRVSLGAGRGRLVRQVLTESLLLAAAGGLLAVLLAELGAGQLVRVLESGRPMVGMARLEIPVRPDTRVLLFTAAAALLTGVLCGLAPTLRSFTALRGHNASQRFGRLLVAAQVALSVGLLSAAGLFLANLEHLQHLDLGFRRDHLLQLRLEPPRSLDPARLSLACEELLARLEATPGVRSASISAPTPLSGAGASRIVQVEGRLEAPQDRRYTQVTWVADRFLETMGTRLLAGREFTPADRRGPRVALVNESMARYYFGTASPLGRRFTFAGEPGAYEIVGVVADANYYEIREAPQRAVYLDAFQLPRPPAWFVARTAIDPLAVASAARQAARQVFPDVPFARLDTLDHQVDSTIVPERLIAMLSGAFGALGALLAAMGLYGLLAYTVARRMREIGIRMALGASPGAVSRMVLGDALLLAGAGLLAGVPLAWWGRRLAAGLVPDLPASPWPIALGAAAMLVIALLAAWLPSRRAARVDPAVTLRYE